MDLPLGRGASDPWRVWARKDFAMLPYLWIMNLFIIVFGGGGRGCATGGCLFWIVLSVGLTILINVVLILIPLLASGPGPGMNL
jgi:hypothetical protein